MTSINAKIERLFEFVKKLNELLDEQEYEQFLLQQALFSDLLKDFMNRHAENELNATLGQLRALQEEIDLLQQRSNNDTQELKQKSLLLQRNKSKISAYK